MNPNLLGIAQAPVAARKFCGSVAASDRSGRTGCLLLPLLLGAAPVSTAITYVDASVIAGRNTFRSAEPADTTWLNTTQDSPSVNDTQWVARYGENFGIEDHPLQSVANSVDFPQITTRISGLEDGTYVIWAFVWEQVASTSLNWGLSAGLASGTLTTYSAPLAGHSRPGTNTGDVVNAANLSFTGPLKVQQVSDGAGGFLQNLLGARERARVGWAM
jgi:hypothetical protein